MHHQKISSSQIESAAYDPKTRTLQVLYKSGGLYNYKDVPPEKYNGLIDSKSPGAYMNENVKDIHDFVKVA